MIYRMIVLLTLGLLAVPDAAAQATADVEGQNLMRNIDSLAARGTAGQSESVASLRRELETLWDRPAQMPPLDVQVVYNQVKDGYKTLGVYVNAFGGPAGQDRIFFYYHAPENAVGRVPAYIELTGGGGPERGLFMARGNKCAVADVEWRGTKNQFRSQWFGSDPGAMKSLTNLKDNPAFRLVYGIRRVIDYLQQQTGVDPSAIGCGGGSMGGYYSLLAAGVDPRVKFVMNELGGGYLSDTDSSLGQLRLDAQRKSIWLAAFDPCSYAARTQAQVVFNLSANDYFFWLGDAVKNYQLLAGDKRLCISPNFNHNDGAFGQKKNSAFNWLAYCMGREQSYPRTPEVTQAGAEYHITTGDDIVRATLCWSPGGDTLIGPARYWLQTPATRTTRGGWKAVVPAAYAGLARLAFVNVWDAKDRMVSSLPVMSAGVDPRRTPGLSWPGGRLWDREAGVSAWRAVGPNVRRPAEGTTLSLEEGEGLLIGPGKGSTPAFSLAANSVILVAGSAKTQRGLKLEIDGRGTAGALSVSLVRDFGAASRQREYTATVPYQAGLGAYELPWASFKASTSVSADNELFGFDTLRLDGERPDGSPLLVKTIHFLEGT
jgi:cephalosporin-C deacetylase-like acetyl esterase